MDRSLCSRLVMALALDGPHDAAAARGEAQLGERDKQRPGVGGPAGRVLGQEPAHERVQLRGNLLRERSWGCDLLEEDSRENDDRIVRGERR